MWTLGSNTVNACVINDDEGISPQLLKSPRITPFNEKFIAAMGVGSSEDACEIRQSGRLTHGGRGLT